MGLFIGAVGFGAFLAAISLAAQRSRARQVDRRLAIIAGLGAIGFGFSHWIWLSFILLMMEGFGMFMVGATCNTIMQTIVDEEKRSRVLSYYAMFFVGSSPIGHYFGGWLADSIGAPLTFVVGGVICRSRHRVHAAARYFPGAPAQAYIARGIMPSARRHWRSQSMTTLAGKTLFHHPARAASAADRIRAARDRANVVVAAKTAEPHPKLSGTIHTVAEEIEKAGGKALPIQLDVRDDAAIAAAIEQTVKKFGGLDILVNNAGAISLTPTLATPARRFDLMMTVNARATFLCSQAAIAHLKKSKNAHILTLSPPLGMKAKWFAGHVAYTMSKYGMSMCTLGMAEEFKGDGIAVNSLWPRTTIATAAVEVHFPEAILRASRTAAIMADAAHVDPHQRRARRHRQLLHRRGSAEEGG